MADTCDTERIPPKWPYKSETILTAHPNGTWMKKWKQKPYYFGPWADPQGALARWRSEWPDITAGRERLTMTTGRGAITVLALCTAFIEACEKRVADGKLDAVTFRDYKRTTKRICARLGNRAVHTLTPSDFAALLHVQDTGLYDRAKFVVWTRGIFKWGDEAGLIEPVRFGPEFLGPTAKAIRRYKRETQGEPFTRKEIQRMLKLADPLMRAAILLGLNGGYEPKQLCKLKGGHIDREARCIDTVRDKTEAGRIIPLWPETMKALRAVYRDGLIFINDDGTPMSHGNTYGMTKRFTALLKKAKCHTPGKSFYHLRRTFSTYAAEVKDKDASKVIVGHVLAEVHDGYILTFPRERLRTLVNHVRQRLFGIKP